MPDRPMRRFHGQLGALALLVVAALTVPLLQTIPNGSQHYYMIDVGETQIVLNTWGTLHATGYPHYVMTGSALVALLRAVGVDAAAAPAVVSLLWGMIALAVVYALLLRVGVPPLSAAGTVVAFGLARSVWIHLVIAEIYSFMLLLLALLLLLGQSRAAGRAYWLALIGGLAVAHHRALAFAAPALIYAAWADLFGVRRAIVGKLAACAGLALIGFVPYVYLPLRAAAGAAWVYGDPGTLAGFLDQFLGREANRFLGVGSVDGLIANFGMVTGVLLTDVGALGILIGLAGLIVGALHPETRRAAIMLLLVGAAAYGFHVLAYTDVLSALILMILLPLAVGWGMAATRLIGLAGRAGALAALVIAAAGCIALHGAHRQFIRDLTTDPAGQTAIAAARRIPTTANAVIPWGVHHFAVGFARDVTHEIGGFALHDHNADLRRLLVAPAPLVTPPDTFYNQPVSWWEARTGVPVYLSAAAPGWVQVSPERRIDRAALAATVGVEPLASALDCEPDALVLTVEWRAAAPTRDLSVFVHLLDAAGAVIAQADQSAPVYGWRPLTTFAAAEVVRDIYLLPRLPAGVAVRFGLYTQLPDGGFENVLSSTLPLICP